MFIEWQEPRSITFARIPATPSLDDAVLVEIFAKAGKWYCHVRRGHEKTRPMGPYTRQEAQRIQAIRKLLLAKKGVARLIFEPAADA
jgi:hypothetical protein